MPVVKKTISLPKPLYDFAVKESKNLSLREKGESKENVSAFVAELIRIRRAQVQGPEKKAA